VHLKSYIHETPNWPKNNVSFKDISPLLANTKAFNYALDTMNPNLGNDYWVGIESRGFIFASALAQRFGGGVILVRKPGKLPPPFISHNYQLEYGNDSLEIKPGCGKVVIVDDVLATGGTLLAANHLCKQAGYEVLGNTVLINLEEVHQQRPFIINGKPVFSVVNYDLEKQNIHDEISF